MNWILCPLHNGLHLTRAALRTFLAQDVPCNVLLLDNASTDGTVPWLNGIRDERVLTMLMMKPLSVAASWNAMLRWVFKREDHAIVVNNDTLLRPDTVRHLLADGGLFVTAVGTDDPSKIDPPYHEPDPAKKRPHPDFSCFAIRKECYQRVGPFSEEYAGGYCEDADYHLRMHRAGIDAVCLDLPFYHVGAGTLKSVEHDQARKIQLRADKNRALFRKRYGVDVGSPEYYALFGHGAPTAEAVTLEAASSEGNCS